MLESLSLQKIYRLFSKVAVDFIYVVISSAKEHQSKNNGVLGKNNSNKKRKDQAAKEMFSKTKQKVVWNLSVCVLNLLPEVGTLLSLVAISFVERTYKFFNIPRDLILVNGGILLC